MNIKWNQIVIFSVLTLVLASCTDEKEEPVLNPSITVVGGDSHVFEVQGGTWELNLTSTKAWTARSGQSWCRVTPAGGQGGNATLVITVDENTTPDERNTSVTIQSETVTKSIVVTQKQKDALTVTSSKIEMEAEGGKAHIEVKSNVSYSCEVESSVQSWISVSTSSRAMTSSVVELQIQENEELEKREGKVYIRSGEMTETVTIYQAGATPSLVLTQNEYWVGSKEEVITIQLKSNVEYQMQMPEATDWLKVVENRAISDYTHYVLVAANETYDSRSAEILFVNEAEGLSERVKITQMQKNAIIVSQNEYTLEAVTTELSFEINTNVEFEVTTSVDWIRYGMESRALEVIPLTFTIDENVSVESREGYISILSEGIKQDIKIIQQGRKDNGKIRILHSKWDMIVPLVKGRNLQGQIYWGDGKQEAYQERLDHQYNEGKEYVLLLDLWGAEEIEIPTIEGVIEIDLSEF